MQKIQDSVFSIVKTTNLSPAVFNFLQPSDELEDKTPLGGILKDTKYGWLALGPKFCVVDLRTGLKVAARTFGAVQNSNTSVTCVVELPKPLTENSQQLVISLQCDNIGMVCILHVNGSQILWCLQTDVIVTELTICDRIPNGPFSCFDGLVMAGTIRGEIFAFDLNRASLIKALKDVSQGHEHLVQNESNPTNLSFLPINSIQSIEEHRELALEKDQHLAIILNENSILEGHYIYRNPDGTVRMKAKRNLVQVTVLQYIPQLGSLAVGFNFGAFQLWNLMTMDLEFTSPVNVECLPVTHFAFQEPCDDPRVFCYLWVVFSVINRNEKQVFPLAVMYSLTYQRKSVLSDNNFFYQDFSTAAVRFQVELSSMEESPLLWGKCISCHSYSIKSPLGEEDSMLNICQLAWECWGDDANSPMQYGMLLFDLDQWYKDQMPSTYHLESNTFMSATWCTELAGRGSVTLHARLDPSSVSPYTHATRLEEHFYPNSLQYNCICLNTSEALTLRTVGVQRQIVAALETAGGAALLHPARLYAAATRAGLAPLHSTTPNTEEDQRRYLLSVALEARLSRFLKRCAHDWATGTHAGVGCTLPFLVDWAWKRALELKENTKELTASLFMTSTLPDGNVVRNLEHSVQQLSQLTGLMDSILTKCCNLVVPNALSEMEEAHVGIGCVSLYLLVVQWLLRVGLLPERASPLPYRHTHLADIYQKRRMKLNRLQDISDPDDNVNKSCSLLYIDQLIENEFGGDKIHQMWIKGGSECGGLYPPPSLYTLLRIYLMPDISEEHKHSLVLYLLLDYAMVYDDVRYEAVVRRLMQFPTMFGLSNTAIKATQAFWHLDHRDFDFALNQLQCLTGNTLSEWQHNVVLSSLLAQKKTQAALQYLHARKPPPVHNQGEANYSYRFSEQDKMLEWQCCCSLYLSRGLVHAALDVVRECTRNASTQRDKENVLNYFYKGCRNTGNLSKILQLALLPFEEEVFTKYLEDCNESQTSDLLIMFYLQQARYIEARRYNNKLKKSKPQRNNEISASMESLFDVNDREGTRDALVEVVCSALPSIASTVALCASKWDEVEPHVLRAPKPLSVFVQTKSSKNTFTYKSSFIQDTIENASETWMNRPKMRKGLKRALDIEETPFICTPKLIRTKSIFSEQHEPGSTPPKRARMSLTNTPCTPKMNTSFRVTEKMSKQMEQLLDMPDAQSPVHVYNDRAGTPHSILKIRRNGREETASPADSRYLGDSEDELLETASNHTHYSDTTNKHLRFTIPTASESGSTSSPLQVDVSEPDGRDRDADSSAAAREKEMDVSTDSYCTTTSHAMNENNPLESPPKKVGETNALPRKSYKDTVRARLSISANSSLSEDPNTSIESIADIPVTLINPRYSGERRRTTPSPLPNSDEEQKQENLDISTQREFNIQQESLRNEYKYKTTSTLSSVEIRVLEKPSFSLQDIEYKQRFGQSFEKNVGGDTLEVPRTPTSRRGIRSMGESTPVSNRNMSGTPEHQDSPVVTPMRSKRITRSRSRSKTPELSPRSSPLAPIPELPKQERESEPHEHTNILSVPRQLRSRSRTPERMDLGVSESPKLEVIKESPTKSSDSPTSSPATRSLRSRSRTPEVEVIQEPVASVSPRTLRSRSKTPEKLMSPKKDYTARTKKSLSRMVLEQNTFAKTKQTLETLESEITESKSGNTSAEVIECTPMKTLKEVPRLMDVTLSPILNKSPSTTTDTKNINASDVGVKTLPAFTTLHEAFFEKSVLKSYQSSIEDDKFKSMEIPRTDKTVDSSNIFKPLVFTSMNESDFNKSVLHSYESSMGDSASQAPVEIEKPVEKEPNPAFTSMIDIDFGKSVLRSHESSVATPDASKEIQNVNASSLLTNDSDIDVKETESQDTAVRKEKDRIVEIEREINEIEENMSDDSERNSNDSESGEGDNISEEESSDSVSSTEPSTRDSEEELEYGENEVISIVDSDSDDSETSNTNTDSNTNTEDAVVAEVNKQVELISENVVMLEKAEGSSIDPLNQAQVSLMTDDNSVIESDQSMVLNYSDEIVKVREDVQEQQNEQDAPTMVSEIIPEITSEDNTEGEAKSVPEGMDVVDTLASKVDVIEPPQPEITKNKGTINIEKEKDVEGMNVVIVKSDNARTPDTAKESESDKTTHEIPPDNVIEAPKHTIQAKKSQQVELVIKAKESIQTEVRLDQDSKETSVPDKLKKVESMEVIEPEKPEILTRKRVRSTSSNKDTEISKDIPEDKESEAKDPLPVIEETKEIEEPRTPVIRKRANSNASAKSKSSKEIKDSQVKETTENDEEEIKTPARRKRGSSNASKTDVKTPEDTPSRRRARTPTSSEVRKIITRRVSREMGLLDKSNESLEDSFSLTPKRRSARSKSKQDDNESVASESSVVSNMSKVSEDADARPVRKGRKSVLSTKPDLSVIPEGIAEESKDETEVTAGFSGAKNIRRANRLASIEAVPSPRSRRRLSTASRASRSTINSDLEEEPHPGFDVEPIDRISLLNKTDFEGSPDSDELQNISPGNVAADATQLRRSRLVRAASESRTAPRPAKIGRRIASIDVAETSELGSPGPSGTESPMRTRRASFNRACEALHTPKGRRNSTDVRSPVASPATSETEVGTPARRSRRTNSQLSNTSVTKADVGKRSNKMPVVEEEDKKN